MSDELTAFIQDLCHFEKFGGRCMRKEFGVWEVSNALLPIFTCR